MTSTKDRLIQAHSIGLTIEGLFVCPNTKKKKIYFCAIGFIFGMMLTHFESIQNCFNGTWKINDYTLIKYLMKLTSVNLIG
jgi:hypothetical protein